MKSCNGPTYTPLVAVSKKEIRDRGRYQLHEETTKETFCYVISQLHVETTKETFCYVISQREINITKSHQYLM
jgi:hypothetical protein